MIAKRPERVIELAIKGMLPKNKLGKAMAKKLKVYADAEHPHSAQRPQAFDLTHKTQFKIRLSEDRGRLLWLKFSITEPGDAKRQPPEFICDPAPAK